MDDLKEQLAQDKDRIDVLQQWGDKLANQLDDSRRSLDDLHEDLRIKAREAEMLKVCLI